MIFLLVAHLSALPFSNTRGTRPICPPRTVQLTGVQLEHELHGVVVKVTAVLDDLDEGGQAALAGGHLRHRNGCVELPEN